MKRALSAFGFAAISIVGIAGAQTAAGIEARIQAEMARWKAQQAAANRDVELTNEVLRDFFTSTNPTEGQPIVASVNVAIQPLKSRFPDYRLNYRTDADYCPIMRAIVDARRTAFSRVIQAIDQQQHLLLINQIHISIMTIKLANDVTGKPENSRDVDNVFLREVAEISQSSTRQSWGGLDYFPVKISGRDCN